MKAPDKASRVSFAPCAAAPPPEALLGGAPKPGMDGAVVSHDFRWPTGSTLAVGFLDGSREARKAVADLAKQWTEHANLEFVFHLGLPPANLDILITFDDPACTSALGTSSRFRSEKGEASMTLCGIDQRIGERGFHRIVLHEFGHAIGLEHEHQNPKAKHSWNREAVYRYYETRNGWDRKFVDQWVFRQIEQNTAAVSDYDPDSVMHYFFPPEFTTNGVAFGGNHELSDMDKSFIAQVYPGRGANEIPRRFERRLAVRNETGVSLKVQAIYETGSGKKAAWAPKNDPNSAAIVRVPVGTERVLAGPGRRARLIARSNDGHSTWGEWSTTPIRIAPEDGYLDNEMQTFVVVIDGPPDPPKGQTGDELYASASQALKSGDHEIGRALFEDFVHRFSGDSRVPWARFNIVTSWYADGSFDEALDHSYDLIVAHPRSDAAPYAWFYGGISALAAGWCDGANDYLSYASEVRSGLPADWRKVAAEYTEAIKADPKRWCL